LKSSHLGGQKFLLRTQEILAKQVKILRRKVGGREKSKKSIEKKNVEEWSDRKGGGPN